MHAQKGSMPRPITSVLVRPTASQQQVSAGADTQPVPGSSHSHDDGQAGVGVADQRDLPKAQGIAQLQDEVSLAQLGVGARLPKAPGPRLRP